MTKVYLLLFVCLASAFLVLTAQAQRYVKSTPSGNADGSSWANASSDLQAMINASSEGESVYVAEGTYKPNAYPPGCTECKTQKDFAFLLKSGVKIYGGFPNEGQPTLADRHWNKYKTWLSGDFNGDDTGIYQDPKNSENAFHVVLSANDARSTLLDGFWLTGANPFSIATSIGVEGRPIKRYVGGALYTSHSSVSVARCTIKGNFGIGAGVYNDSSDPIFFDVTLTKNFSESYGGGSMEEGATNSLYVKCNFIQNFATHGGGAAARGGNSIARFVKCVFHKNGASYGGAAHNDGGQMYFENSVIAENSGSHGAVLFIQSHGTTEFVNSTIAKNNGYVYSGIVNIDGTLRLTNSISWGNNSVTKGDSNVYGGGGVDAKYSIIHSEIVFPGQGNLNSSPKFADFSDLDGPDNYWRTADDGLILLNSSPAIDAASSTEAPSDDIMANPVFNMTRDIGAYEQGEGNPVYDGTIACQTMTLNNVLGDKWYYFKNENGLVAAFNPHGSDLGTLTLKIGDPDDVLDYHGSKFLGRNISLTSSNYPAGQTLPTAYTIRLYYHDTELSEYNSATSGSFTPSDLNMAWKEGADECVLSVNEGDSTGIISNTAIATGEYGMIDSGFYVEFSVNHFTLFLATTLEHNPLPVRLISFTAQSEGNHNLLKWQTASEDNNAFFQVERSKNGILFKAIGEIIPGAGDSEQKRSYSHIDPDFEDGINYYRLKQVDLDGKFAYSRTVPVRNKHTMRVNVYPNPAQSLLYIDSQSPVSSYRIIDSSGQQKLSGKNDLKQPVIISSLAPGVYLLELGNETFKFVKE